MENIAKESMAINAQCDCVRTIIVKSQNGDEEVERVTSRTGFHIGINFVKGFFFTIFCGSWFFSMSKDGIANCVARYKYGCLKFALLARLIALIDTIFFAICVPFFIVTYIVLIIVTFFGVIIFGIVKLFKQNDTIFSSLRKTLVGSLISLALVLGNTILTPLGIISPEFTIKICYLHKWSTILAYCY